MINYEAIEQELSALVESLSEIPPEKRYWLIRTQSGSLYDTFIDNNFIAIEHDELSFSKIDYIRKTANGDFDIIKKQIREEVKSKISKASEEASDDEILVKNPGLRANQIYKFVFEIKKGDIVVIPSINSDVISFGTVQESYIASFSMEDERKMGCDYILKKKVGWIKNIYRSELDPYLWRLFMAHQAVNEVGGYAEIIERSLRDLFIIDNEAHLIINVETKKDIKAKDLFGLGSNILELIDEFAQFAKVDVSSSDLQVRINLNSPGKIDLKSQLKKTSVWAGIVLLVAGGGYKSPTGHQLTTEGISAILNAWTQYVDHKNKNDITQREEALKEKMFEHYKDSLHIKDPQDLKDLMKQVSDNKDLAK